MDKIYAVMKREFLERVRSRWFFFATVFGPLLMALLMILPAYLASKSKASDDVSRIIILDASGGPLGERVAQRLGIGRVAPELRIIAPAEIAVAESLATKAVIAKSTRGYLVMDALTASGERARYSGENGSTIPDMQFIEAAIRQSILTLRFEDAGMDASRVQALSNIKLDLEAERLSDRGRGGGGRSDVALAYLVAVLLYMSIVLYGQAIMMGVIEEKSQRVAEVIVASIPADKLLAGKVIGMGAVGLSQQLFWVFSGFMLVKFQQPITSALGIPSMPITMPSVSLGTGLAYLAFFILGFVFFSSLFAAAGSMVSSTQDAQQVATPLTMLIIPSMVLIGPVLLEPTGALARFVTLLPFTAPILMPVRMSITSVPVAEVLASIGLLIGACFAAVWVAARIYRVGVLMYGKKPSLSELMRWIRVST